MMKKNTAAVRHRPERSSVWKELRKMLKIAAVLKCIVLVLSHAMCAAVAWEYCSLLWAGRYAGASAPAWTALLLAIPFILAIAVCLILGKLIRRGE